MDILMASRDPVGARGGAIHLVVNIMIALIISSPRGRRVVR
jgi:hypothetical protein